MGTIPNSVEAGALENILCDQLDGRNLELPPLGAVSERVLARLRKRSCDLGEVAEDIAADQVSPRRSRPSRPTSHARRRHGLLDHRIGYDEGSDAHHAATQSEGEDVTSVRNEIPDQIFVAERGGP